jgi:hypothetical protein
MAVIPDSATHYHLADKAPFLNLSDLADKELEVVMRDLEQRRADAGLRRVFGRRYIQMRRRTESRMRELFIAAGGTPERRAPHYFCLGPCPWFRELSPSMRELAIPLTDLPPAVTSFTYPDSFTAMCLGREFGLPHECRPYHDRVYSLAELPDLVETYGLPAGDADADYEGYERRPFEKYIEIQVWADEPVRRAVRRTGCTSC